LNSPLIFADPDGRDIMLLYNKVGAGKAGHTEVLIGNEKDGWALFSKNGEKSVSEQYDNGLYCETLSDLANDETQSKYEL